MTRKFWQSMYEVTKQGSATLGGMMRNRSKKTKQLRGQTFDVVKEGLKESQAVEAEWKGKPLELWEHKTFEPGGCEAMPYFTPTPEIAEISGKPFVAEDWEVKVPPPEAVLPEERVEEPLAQCLEAEGKPPEEEVLARTEERPPALYEGEFVNELLNKYNALLKQQGQLASTSLRTLSERALVEANRVADTIKMRAKREAEAEAGRMINEAKERVQEMMVEAENIISAANKKAEIIEMEAKQAEAEAGRMINEARERVQEMMVEAETENIISAANKKAEIIEMEAKQQAQLFLIRSRQTIESELRAELREAYNRLFSSLYDLQKESQAVEAEWKGKTLELWKHKAFEPEEYEAMPYLTPTPEIAEISGKPFVAEEREVEVPPPEAVLPEEKVEEPLAQCLEAEEKPPEEEVLAGTEERPPTLYEGEVELVLSTPVDPAAMSELYDRLQEIPDLKVLRTVGSWDGRKHPIQETTIVILLDKTLPLVDVLANIPSVEAIPEVAKKESAPHGLLKKIETLGTKGKPIRRVRIALKKQTE